MSSPRSTTTQMRCRRAAGLAALAVAAFAAHAGPAGAATATFTNTTPIKTPLGKGVASPYPSAIEVADMPGRVTDVVVRIPRFKVDYPDDIDILLVSPDGDASIVMSDACDTDRDVERSFTFSDAVATQLPLGRACDAGFYRPTNHLIFTDVWPEAAARPHVADFSRFRGKRPNGTWRLLVLDDLSGGTASELAEGWTLTITSQVPAALVPAPGGTGSADVYPLTKTVSGRPGVILDVNVSIPSLLHDRPDDLDLQLVGPNGQAIDLMSDACGNARLDTGLAWDDEATAPLTDDGPCPDGTYRPTDRERDDTFPLPATRDGDALSLSAFDGISANGQWRLFAFDDRPIDAHGMLLHDFNLHISTRPHAAVGFRRAALELTEGESGALTLVRDSDGDPLGAGEIEVNVRPGGATPGTDVEPLPQTVVLEHGRRTATIPLRALADELPEGTETLVVELGKPSGDADAPEGPAALATVTIRDRPAAPMVPAAGPIVPPGGPLGPVGPEVRSTRDTSAPQTRIVAAPKRRTTSRRPTFRFTADERGTRFECRVDRRRFTPCRSGRRLARLRTGRHVFAVRAIDAAGNADRTPAQRTWRIVK